MIIVAILGAASRFEARILSESGCSIEINDEHNEHKNAPPIAGIEGMLCKDRHFCYFLVRLSWPVAESNIAVMLNDTRDIPMHHEGKELLAQYFRGRTKRNTASTSKHHESEGWSHSPMP